MKFLEFQTRIMKIIKIYLFHSRTNTIMNFIEFRARIFKLFYARITKTLKFIEFHARIIKNIENLNMQCQNHENREIHRIPHQTHENHENLIISCKNHENYEIHRISNENIANHKNLNI